MPLQKLNSEDRAILDIARKRGMYTQRCQHRDATLVQHTEGSDWFVCWQCDGCGLVLDRDVSAAQIRDGHNLPLLDVLLAERAIAMVAGSNEVQKRTWAFLGKAIK